MARTIWNKNVVHPTNFPYICNEDGCTSSPEKMTIYNQCADEPITIPGKIQNFGYLLGLDQALTIQFYSKNILDLFQMDRIELHVPLMDYEEMYNIIRKSGVFIKSVADDDRYQSQVSILEIHGQLCCFTIKKEDHLYYLEFEPCEHISYAKELEYIDFGSYSKIKNEDQIWKTLAHNVSDYIGYDRVMVYQFLEDGSGMVIAEKIKPGIESYLHLHYPEDDIPKQARALYLTNTRRIFCDTEAANVDVVSSIENLDLSCTELRAMSPVHGQYLRNAGVRSSFSTSIVIDGVLWGLVTCQNIEARPIDLRNRLLAEIVTMWASKAFSNIQAQELVDFSIGIDQKVSELKNRLSQSDLLTHGIIQNFSNFCALAHADGIAMVINHDIHTWGEVPEKPTIAAIIEHYQQRDFEVKKVYFHQAFAKNHPEIMNGDQSLAGLAIAKINTENQKYIIWFRKEYIETIQWAGNPEKEYHQIIKNGHEEMEVSPRKSFKIFVEESKGKSRYWNDRDRISITKLLTVIFEISYDHYTKIRKLNNELVALNEELDSFSYTISHDLGTPLTVMKLNLQMLERKLLNGNTEENTNKVSNVLQQIDNMESLMRDVLSLSRAKSMDLGLQHINMYPLIERICKESKVVYGKENTKIEIGECVDVIADQTLAYQVFLNVISNAVKYSSKADAPLIIISSSEDDQFATYRISDNGIGIPETEKSQMFKIFKRMDNAKTFYGNGVGLNIVYRIMERLGGNVDYHSHTDGPGVTFVVQFKK